MYLGVLKHGPALFTDGVVNETKKGEVVHLHTLDGSMHMTLHPEDVRTVLEKGWGGEFLPVFCGYIVKDDADLSDRETSAGERWLVL